MTPFPHPRAGSAGAASRADPAAHPPAAGNLPGRCSSLAGPALSFATVCSGIEAASQAWVPLGWKPQFFSEIEPFPCAYLAHHYPDVPNRGDMNNWKDWPDATLDVLAGGTPCQSFSVAGLRAGLADPRGNLMLTYLAIARRYRPRWLVWENVPGVLSSNGGRDFGTFLRGLGECGYGFAYRVLDAQHVRTCRFPRAVPQRRRRVWVVGYLGDWRPAAAVLFDAQSLRGDPAPRRETGQRPTGTLKACASSGGWSNSADHAAAGMMVPVANSGDTGYCPTASAQQSLDAETETLIAGPVSFGAQNAAAQGDGVAWDFCAALDKSKTPAVAFDLNQITSKTNRSQPDPAVHHTLPATACPPHLATPWAVRRLTPVECERLQGFHDNATLVPHRGKPASDGPRYKALGNSWAVNCAEWIGQRIEHIEAIKNKTAQAALHPQPDL